MKWLPEGRPKMNLHLGSHQKSCTLLPAELFTGHSTFSKEQLKSTALAHLPRACLVDLELSNLWRTFQLGLDEEPTKAMCGCTAGIFPNQNLSLDTIEFLTDHTEFSRAEGVPSGYQCNVLILWNNHFSDCVLQYQSFSLVLWIRQCWQPGCACSTQYLGTGTHPHTTLSTLHTPPAS